MKPSHNEYAVSERRFAYYVGTFLAFMCFLSGALLIRASFVNLQLKHQIKEAALSRGSFVSTIQDTYIKVTYDKSVLCKYAYQLKVYTDTVTFQCKDTNNSMQIDRSSNISLSLSPIFISHTPQNHY